MTSRISITLLLALALPASSAAAVQSPSELLQQGIYTQETLGDLDGAIRIFKQILADTKANRVYAAQAQYRLGLCLLGKGQPDQAAEAFERLIKEYPDQKELVAKAREHVPGDLKLLPEPWVDGESLQFLARLPGGLQIGTLIYSVESAHANGRDLWRIQTRRYGNESNGVSRVLADRGSLRPISSVFKHSHLGEFQTAYEPGLIQMKVAGTDSVRKMVPDGVVYDNEEALHLVRRLPLVTGYKASFQVLSLLNNIAQKVILEVTARETLQVPAGSFDCWKVEFSLAAGKPLQTVWYSSDEHRYMIKCEAGGPVIELAAIRQLTPETPTVYRDANFGFSLSVPARWNTYTDEMKNRVGVHLLDPDAAGVAVLWMDKIEKRSPPPEADLRKAANEKIANRQKEMETYALRPASILTRSLAGAPAISFTADYVESKRPMVEHLTMVDNGSLRGTLALKAARDEYEPLREAFLRILETLRFE